ncbi:hypothetical protein Scep_026589 [Stephania cephalantha]|uniref:USP domain-containing protein n=1 Tax=Stephania cephalantha TaxID=152367 RepID=A0AAP0EN04_9MAGN
MYLGMRVTLILTSVSRGNPNFGHYLCYIRSSLQTWHEFNDNQVMEVSEEFALSQKAYILFYVRETSPWFPTLMEDQKH